MPSRRAVLKMLMVGFLEEMYGREHVEGASHVKDLTGDKGYHSPRGLGIIQEAAGLRTIIGDPNAARRQPANPGTGARRAVAKTARAVKSKSGKALLQKRGEQIERGSAHVPDCGGLGRTTLRGRINNNKRYLCGIPAFNLSLGATAFSCNGRWPSRLCRVAGVPPTRDLQRSG